MVVVTGADTACTTTADNAGVEFYDLAAEKVLAIVVLPNSGGQPFFSGAEVRIRSPP